MIRYCVSLSRLKVLKNENNKLLRVQWQDTRFSDIIIVPIRPSLCRKSLYQESVESTVFSLLTENYKALRADLRRV